MSRLLRSTPGAERPSKRMPDYSQTPVTPEPTTTGVLPLHTSQAIAEKIGVVVHLNRGNIYRTRYTDGTLAAMVQEAGFTLTRCLFETNSDAIARFNAFHQATGMRYELIFGNAKAGGTTNATLLTSVAQLTPGSVAGIESSNEWNIGISGGGYAGWEVDARAHMLDIYTRVKGHSTTWIKNIPVYSTSIANPYQNRNIPGGTATSGFGIYYLGDVRDRCDAINVHQYYAAGGNSGTVYQKGPGGTAVPDVLAAYARLNPDHPYMITESGGHNLIGGTLHAGTSEEAFKYHILEGAAEHMSRNARKALTYEFLDEPDKAHHELAFGLVRSDNTKKPAFTSLKNFMALMKDTGGVNATPVRLDYAISNKAATYPVTDFLVQRQDGSHYIFVWRRGLPHWHYGNELPYSPQPTPTTHTLSFPSGNKSITVYRPSDQATSVQTGATAASHSISLPKGLTIIHVKP